MNIIKLITMTCFAASTLTLANAQQTLQEAVYTKAILKSFEEKNYPNVLHLASQINTENLTTTSGVSKAIISSYLILSNINNPKDTYLLKAKELIEGQILSTMGTIQHRTIPPPSPTSTNTQSITKSKSNNNEDFEIIDEDELIDDSIVTELDTDVIISENQTPEIETITLDDKSWLEMVQLNLFSTGFVHDYWMNTVPFKEGLHYYHKKNYEKAKELFEQASAYDNGYSMIYLGEISLLLNQKYKDDLEAPIDYIAYYEQAAEAHLSKGITQYLLATSKVEKWTSEDWLPYKSLIETGVSLFDPLCFYWYGNIISSAKNVSKKQYLEAYQYYTYAAKYNIQGAFERLIEMHINGNGVHKSENEAKYWLNRLQQVPNISNATLVKYENLIKTMK